MVNEEMNTKQRLLIYRDLLLSNKAEADKFRKVNSHDERFIALLEIVDKIGSAFIRVGERHLDSIRAALNETPELQEPMLDSVMETIKEETLKAEC